MSCTHGDSPSRHSCPHTLSSRHTARTSGYTASSHCGRQTARGCSAALKYTQKRGFMWLNLHITKAFFLRRENHLNSECSSLNGAVWAFKAVNKIRCLRWWMGKCTIRAAWSRQKSSSPLLREYWHWDDLTQLLTRSKQKQQQQKKNTTGQMQRKGMHFLAKQEHYWKTHNVIMLINEWKTKL